MSDLMFHSGSGGRLAVVADVDRPAHEHDALDQRLRVGMLFPRQRATFVSGPRRDDRQLARLRLQLAVR